MTYTNDDLRQIIAEQGGKWDAGMLAAAMLREREDRDAVLRAEFAKATMTVILDHFPPSTEKEQRHLAKRCWEQADIMLSERVTWMK